MIARKEDKMLNKNPSLLPDFNDPVAAARAWADLKEENQKLRKKQGGAKTSEDPRTGLDLYQRAKEIVIKDTRPSISYVQRKLRIGYGKAANLFDQMEEEGLIERAKTRKGNAFLYKLVEDPTPQNSNKTNTSFVMKCLDYSAKEGNIFLLRDNALSKGSLSKVTCPNCKQEFTKSNFNKVFCTDSCREEAYEAMKELLSYQSLYRSHMAYDLINPQLGKAGFASSLFKKYGIQLLKKETRPTLQETVVFLCKEATALEKLHPATIYALADNWLRSAVRAGLLEKGRNIHLGNPFYLLRSQ